jgi:hypothetical protein
MVQTAEIILGFMCWVVAYVMLVHVMPKIKDSHAWHLQGANCLAMFAIYLGFEAMAPAEIVDNYYWGYLAGNSLFPIGALMIAYGYLKNGEHKKKNK